MTVNPYATYQNTSVMTASPGELTLMLYEGCLKFIRIAKHAIQANNVEQKNINIQKAQSIVNELLLTLDQKFDVATSMASLYDYMHHRLIEANIKNDIAILEEVETLVTEFRDTWKNVIQQNRARTHVSGVI